MSHPRVFVVQNTHQMNESSGSLEPKFNLQPAAEFGELIFLVSPTARPFRSEVLIKEMREKLEDFSDDDYLLLIGNPSLMGFATAIAAIQNQGRVKVLQWSGKYRRYEAIEADFGRIARAA